MHSMRKKLMSLTLLMGFILGSHNGYIALWSDDSIEPDRVFPYRVSNLPPADQEALRKGIAAEDILELTQLMEDYLS